MTRRTTALFAATAMFLAAPAAAEQVTAPRPAPVPASAEPAPTVYASATPVKLSSQAQAPKKRAGRVTTCRCGEDPIKR